ncbi:membrane protein DedA, SNARE-associated domain [Pseudonocardia ammonioxydans]|uniref:Membrane protein DedA, SNARE-associated domain n=1 Tax=Pseudonocardia ammonioxydans TaxID=260086 RepID=A0A1I5CVE9_PSUAM|nr:DedA family protein [Pseudonocardia ammonioxydans]SFN90601.1 membrane protein DedA, SNARE-associated domain [Pseudonocardia ammonioxydans]
MWVVVLVAGVVSLGECTLAVGLVLPGETVLLAAAMAVPDVPAAALVTGVVAGAALGGDAIGYTIGRRLGPRLRETRLIRRMGRDRWDDAARTLRRHGPWAVLGARFLPVVRTMTPAAAGASGLPLHRFLPAAGLGATVWAALHVTAGYLLREAAERLEHTFGVLGWVVLAVGIVAGVAAWKLRRHRAGARARRARAAPTVPGGGAGDTGPGDGRAVRPLPVTHD